MGTWHACEVFFPLLFNGCRFLQGDRHCACMLSLSVAWVGNSLERYAAEKGPQHGQGMVNRARRRLWKEMTSRSSMFVSANKLEDKLMSKQSLYYGMYPGVASCSLRPDDKRLNAFKFFLDAFLYLKLWTKFGCRVSRSVYEQVLVDHLIYTESLPNKFPSYRICSI